MQISDRKKKILAAVVDEYIRTAEPVGSKAIAQSGGLSCSSATIRNELAELVAMGYLEQPHTSAGRVPTPMGYRMYVNELMEKQKMSLEETEEMNRRLNQKLQELDNTIRDVSKLASQLTDYPALALTAQSSVTVKRFDLIYVDANNFIIVLMLSSNTVKSKLVHLPVSVDADMVGSGQGPQADELPLRRRLHPPRGGEPGRQRRGAGPHRTGKRGRGAEGFQRGHRQLRRRGQHPGPDRRGGTHPDGLFRRGRQAQLPGSEPEPPPGRRRCASRGHAQQTHHQGDR